MFTKVEWVLAMQAHARKGGDTFAAQQAALVAASFSGAERSLYLDLVGA